MRYIIRLTESELHRLISGITRRLLSETDDSFTDDGLRRTIGYNTKDKPFKNQDTIKGKIENGTYDPDAKRTRTPNQTSQASGEEPYDPDEFGNNVIDIDDEKYGGFPMELLRYPNSDEIDPQQSRKAIYWKGLDGKGGYTPSIEKPMRRKNRVNSKGIGYSMDDNKNQTQIDQALSQVQPEEVYDEDEKREIHRLIYLALDGNDRDYNILCDHLDGMEFDDICKKYNFKKSYVYRIIANGLQALRKPEFKSKLRQLTQGEYDQKLTRTNGSDNLTSSDDSVNTTVVNSFKKDYFNLVKDTITTLKKMVGENVKDVTLGDGATLTDDKAFKENEFMPWFINKFLPRYDNASEKVKKEIINKIKNTYVHSKFYNKWVKKEGI